METLDFQKLIGKPVYVIWHSNSSFFKKKGNGVYMVLDSRDGYVQLQGSLPAPFWASCDYIEEAREHPESHDTKLNAPASNLLQQDMAPAIEVMTHSAIKPASEPIEKLTPDSQKVAKPKRKRPSRAKVKVEATPVTKIAPAARKPEKSRAYKTKPRIKRKDGVFLCHFGVKYFPGINAIGKGETREDAYHSWKSANDKLMATKAAKRAQKAANGGLNGAA